MPSIAERMAATKRASFVGRDRERILFRDALTGDGGAPFCLLHFYGPGGVGKTALLAAFADLCQENDVPCLRLDGRNIEPSPGGILAALRSGLGISEGDDPLMVLAGPGRRIILIDTYERLTALDGWIRDAFLPGLSEDILVVLAGRQPPSPEWGSETGWEDLIRTVALRNLSPQESRAFLTHRRVPERLHTSAIYFTHGHPLALALLADVAARGSSPLAVPGSPDRAANFAPETLTEIVQTLLDRFIESVPGPLHRAALEICALLRITNEGVLGEMLRGDDGPDAPDAFMQNRDRNHTLFNWLRGLSFIDPASGGVFPHDVVREALLADLRWRDSERYVELHRRARMYYAERLTAAKVPADQQRLLYDCIFLHRDNAVVRAAFDWQESSAVYPDTVREQDIPSLVELVRQYEGNESAALAAFWLERQPERTLVFRDPASADVPAGFFTMLSLRDMTPEERAADPAITAAWDYLDRGSPLRSRETASYLRFWMARDSYQSPSSVQSLIIVHALRHFLTGSNLAFTFFACSDPEPWEAVFDYVQIGRLREAEFLIGERRYGVYGHDWRSSPVSTWLERLYEKEVAAAAAPASPGRSTPEEAPLIVLSEPEFATAVRNALKRLNQADALLGNPLLRSRIVAGRVGPDADATERAAVLRRQIQEAVERLQTTPKQARGYRALRLTYLEPGGTQEHVADLLDIPFSTYRHHLNEGMTAVTGLLWREEVGVGNKG